VTSTFSPSWASEKPVNGTGFCVIQLAEIGRVEGGGLPLVTLSGKIVSELIAEDFSDSPTTPDTAT
jgi:hypothetical protein